jgi:hypothetical protein
MLIDFERIQNHKLSYEHGFPVFKKIFSSIIKALDAT